MARSRFLWLASAMAVLATPSAFAGDPSPYRDPIQAYLTRPDQQEVQAQFLMEAWNKAADACEGVSVTKEQITYFGKITFDAQGTPLGGAWKHTIAATGCGQSRNLNLFYVPDGSGRVTRIPGVPGSSVADLALQRDSIPYLRAGARSVIPRDCAEMQLIDTEYAAPEGNPLAGAKVGPWREYWTVSGCYAAARVTMHFVPDSTGTAITVDMVETKSVDAQ